MIKRGSWLVVLLLCASVVFGATGYGSYFGPYYGAGPYTLGYDPAESYPSFYRDAGYPQKGNFSSVFALPDFVVTEIGVPDELPLYSALQSFYVTVKNVGEGKGEGYLYVDVWFDALNMPSCRTRAIAGGGLGQPHPAYSSRRIRYTYLFPGQEIKVPLFTDGIKTSVPLSCQRPLVDDVTIYAQVNPPGGSLSSGLNPRGRILESDQSNNLASKTIRVSQDQDVALPVTVSFSRGMNAFSIPVTTEMTGSQFKEMTGCELFLFEGTPPRQERSVPLDQLEFASLYEKMKPGVPYFARCSYPVTVEFTGVDPGPFEQELNWNAQNLVPTRVGMQGMRLNELVHGCSNMYSAGTETNLYGIVPGTRNVAGKMITESLRPYNNVVPGQVYIVQCGSSYGGTWDSEAAYSQSLLRPDVPQFVPFRNRASGSSYRYPSRAGAGFGGHTYKYVGLNYFQ